MFIYLCWWPLVLPSWCLSIDADIKELTVWWICITRMFTSFCFGYSRTGECKNIWKKTKQNIVFYNSKYKTSTSSKSEVRILNQKFLVRYPLRTGWCLEALTSFENMDSNVFPSENIPFFLKFTRTANIEISNSPDRGRPTVGLSSKKNVVN